MIICAPRSSISSITPPIVISVIAVVIALVEFVAIVMLVLNRHNPKGKHKPASSLGEEVSEETDYEEVDDHTYTEIEDESALKIKKDEVIGTPCTFKHNRVYFKTQEEAIQRGRETTV